MTDTKTDDSDDAAPAEETEDEPAPKPAPKPAREIGGRGGLDPSRYGDWEKGGRAIDFRGRGAI